MIFIPKYITFLFTFIKKGNMISESNIPGIEGA